MAAVVQRPVRSLLHPRRSVDTPDTEPLPLYTPRVHEADSDAASIVSEAPTYRSDVPSYTASTPAPLIASNGPPATGLPYRRYAPGFDLRPGGPVSDPRAHSYNMANWSTARSGPTNRHYENVARRRMQRETSVTDIMQALAAVPASVADNAPSVSATPSTSTSALPNATISNTPRPAEPSSPYSPAEDPDLVGEAAAAAARSHRLYRESCFVDPREALRGESRSWDFMMVQMKDWDERQQSWNNFRRDMDTGKRGKLARRLGLARRSL